MIAVSKRRQRNVAVNESSSSNNFGASCRVTESPLGGVILTHNPRATARKMLPNASRPTSQSLISTGEVKDQWDHRQRKRERADENEHEVAVNEDHEGGDPRQIKPGIASRYLLEAPDQGVKFLLRHGGDGLMAIASKINELDGQSERRRRQRLSFED